MRCRNVYTRLLNRRKIMKNNRTAIIIRNTLIIFTVTVLYCIVKNFDMSETGLYALFLCDFSIGLCSRFLVGAVLSIFKDSFTAEWMISFLRIFTFAVFLGVSHYLASSLSLAEKKHKNILILMTGIFVLFPFSVTIFAGDTFGFIDIFCMLILLLTAYFCQNGILIFFTPLLMIAGIFIHDCFLTAYMSPCLAIIAYYCIKRGQNTLRKTQPFIVSAAVSVATAVYSVFFSRQTLTMSADEMLSYLAKKGNTTVENISGYIEDAVTWVDVRQVAPADADRNGFNNILYMLKFGIEEFSLHNLVGIISVLPILALVIIVWIKAIKCNGTFSGKVPYILFVLTLIPQCLSMIMSNDFTRFLSPLVITQIFFLFVTVKNKDGDTAAGLDFIGGNPQMLLLPCMSVVLMNIL